MRSFSRLLCFSCTLCLFLAVGEAHANDAASFAREAMRAEVEGDTERRRELLSRALTQDADARSARWQMGHLQRDGRWLPISDAETLNTVDKHAEAYGEMRDRCGSGLAGQVLLARWCRKNQLHDRERMHWEEVLRRNSNHQEARTRLRLREFRGQLMTSEEIKEWKLALARYEVAQRKWDPQLNRLHREINASAVKKESEAWGQLAQINDSEAVPSLEKLTQRAAPVIQLLTIDTIAEIQSKLSADALVRLSLDLDDDVCRAQAAAGLQNHSWYSFVPQYLAALEAPIEYDWAMSSYGDFVSSHLRLRQERANDVLNVTHARKASITMLGGPRRQDLQTYRVVVAQEARRQEREIGNTVRQVDQNNTRAAKKNRRVYAALRESTEMQIDPLPHLWWDWWKQHNEYELAANKRERLVTFNETRQETIPALPPPPGSYECFPAGTPVRTEIGLRPIETLRRGDRVLSQNVKTGELSYKLVLQTTTRKPSPCVRISLAKEEVTSTLGHPFWVIGKGWTMAKDLRAGDRLHTAAGGIAVRAVEEESDVEAYNLVVADNHNYFVGTTDLLVHDNELPGPTFSPLPGWSTHVDLEGTELVRVTQ
ncbi:MAG: polymorphic toxin-type HINT domain-containing protein [Planctomycetota bacterium]